MGELPDGIKIEWGQLTGAILCAYVCLLVENIRKRFWGSITCVPTLKEIANRAFMLQAIPFIGLVRFDYWA